MWRFVEMYGAENTVDWLIAAALTASSRVLLSAGDASELTAPELADAVAPEAARLRGCWRLIEPLLPKELPKELPHERPHMLLPAERGQGWQRWDCLQELTGPDARQLAVLSWLRDLPALRDKKKTVQALIALADRVNAATPTSIESSAELADRLIALAEADSEFWRALNLSTLCPEAADDVGEALAEPMSAVVLTRWQRGQRRAERMREGWLNKRKLRSLRRLNRHSKALADLLLLLSDADASYAAPSLEALSQLQHRLSDLDVLRQLRKQTSSSDLTGKDLLRVQSAFDVGITDAMAHCVELADTVYGPSSDAVEIELRSSIAAMAADRHLSLAALPGQQARD